MTTYKLLRIKSVLQWTGGRYCAVGFMVAHYLTVAVFYGALSTLLATLFAPGV